MNWAKYKFEFEDYNDTKIFKLQEIDALMELVDLHSMDLMGRQIC